MAFVFQV